MRSWHEHLRRAWAAIELKRWDLANAEIVQALDDGPEIPILHATRAEICYRQRNYEEGRAAAREAIVLDPDWQVGHYWLTWCVMSDFLAGPDRRGEAARIADQALACDPDDVDSHYVRAAAARFGGAIDEAETFATAGLQIDPEHVGCLEVLAWSQIDLRRDNEAELTLCRWLQIDPEAIGAHEAMARIALRTKRFGAAYDHISSALRQDPGRAELRELHGEVVRHQHVLARFFLWSVSPWEQYPYLLVPIGMAPLFALAIAPKIGGWREAVLAALAFFFTLTFAFYGVLATMAAETIIAHSARLSVLVPELRATRSIFAFGWIAGAGIFIAALLSAVFLTPQPLQLAGNGIVAGIAVLIGRWAGTRIQMWAAFLACVIPCSIQIAAFCWVPDRADRGAMFPLILSAWCITILWALIAGGRATGAS